MQKMESLQYLVIMIVQNWVEPLEKMGVDFLINENTYIYREESCLVFSGLDDMHYYNMADINKCIFGL